MPIDEMKSGIFLGNAMCNKCAVLNVAVKYGGCIGVSNKVLGDYGILRLCQIEEEEIGDYGAFKVNGANVVSNYFKDTRSIDVLIENLLELKQSMANAKMFKNMFSVDEE